MIPAAGHPAHLLLGLLVWSIWFVALYGGLSVACAVAPPPVAAGALNWINGTLLLLTLLVTALLLAWARRCLAAVKPPAESGSGVTRFLPAMSAALYLAAAAATLAVGVPVIVLPPCL